MAQNLSAAFAQVLRRHRVQSELSQEGLAHKAKVHRTYVGLIERGIRKPTIEIADRLARALGVSLSEMIREAERRL